MTKKIRDLLDGDFAVLEKMPYWELEKVTEELADEIASDALAKQTKSIADSKRALFDACERLNNNRRFREALHRPATWGAPAPATAAQLLDSDPEMRLYWRTIIKVVGRARSDSFIPEEVAAGREIFPRGVLHDGTFNNGLVAHVNSPEFYNLTLGNGSFRHFVLPIDGGKVKLATISVLPDSYVFPSTAGGSLITEDTAVAGATVDTECGTIGTVVAASNSVISDGNVAFEAAILEALTQGLAYRADWCAFMAAGAADEVDGGYTGIFSDPAVPVATAAAGNTSVASLTPDDFASCIAGVAPSALQKPCRWFLSPAFVPALLKIKDSGQPLLVPPRIRDGEFSIFGYPVSLVGVAPSTDAPASKVALFGRVSAYAVTMRRDVEIMASAKGAGFVKNTSIFRGIMRAGFAMRDATSFAILKTAAA